MPGPSPGEIERSLIRIAQLQAELARKERAVGRKVQVLARSLAHLMQPGDHLHRIGVGLRFRRRRRDVPGCCVSRAEGDDFRYRYAVLCGGETAKRALRDAALDPGDSDEPRSRRRIALAGYTEYDDFVYRLPKYIADVSR